jgi:pimeloyl-ACP methyl ester carboxylesterase
MNTVTSKDGTTITYDKAGQGQGPVLVLVTGALGTRADDGDMVNRLAPHFTVISYDRRGRGDSGDTQPYAVQREVEDIEALIDANGGSAYLYGQSSGGVLSLETASQLTRKVTKLALYEPPLILDDSRPRLPADYVDQLNAAIAAGNRGKAVEIFMTEALLIPAEYVETMKNPPPQDAPVSNEESAQPPSWSEMEAVAHTLAYDGMIVRDTAAGVPLPQGKWATTRAKTVVITGGNSEPFFHDGAATLAKALPYAEHWTLPGQDHAVAPAKLVPMLIDFYTA